MNFTYYDKDKFVNRYDTLTYSTTYKGPNACLGIG